MGEVYRAKDAKLEREIAIKVLPAELARDPERLERFRREAKSIAALKHPNIVTIHSVEEVDGVHFLTMELVEGKTLLDALPSSGFAIDRFFEVSTALADAIHEAHSKGITHRDLKPLNIMFDASGRPKVLDFGLAKLLEPAVTDQEATLLGSGSKTQEGMVLGTVAYMSPEQAEGKSIDPRSDIFSLGILLYEMATGERPFQGESNMATLSSIIKDTPAPVTERKRTLPRHLGRIIQHCLAKDPERRYQSALDVRNELEGLRSEIASGELEQSANASQPAQGVSRKLVLGFGAAVIVVAAAVAAIVGRDRGVESPTPPSSPTRVVAGGTPTQMVVENSLAIMALENKQDPDDEDRYGQILQDLIITDLSGTEPLKVFSSQRLYDIQRLLGKGKDRSLDRDVATEVARRAGAELMLTGSIAQLEDRWIMSCQVSNVSDGTVTLSERINGTDLFAMTDELTERIQAKMTPDLQAEPTGEVHIDVAEKTTTSIEAYQHYIAGQEASSLFRLVDAIREFDQAVAIDSTFGQAYFELALALTWNEEGGSTRNAHPVIEKLLSGNIRLTERERRIAEALPSYVEGDFARTVPQYRRLAREYPGDKTILYILGESLFHHPDPDSTLAGLEVFRAVLELDPTQYGANLHLTQHELIAGHSVEVESRARTLIESQPDVPLWYQNLLVAAVLQGDSRKIDEAIDLTMTRLEDSDERRGVFLYASYLCDYRLQRRLLMLAYPDHSAEIPPDICHAFGNNSKRSSRFDEARAWYRRAGTREDQWTRKTNALLATLDAEEEKEDRVAQFYGDWLEDDPSAIYPNAGWIPALVYSGRIADARFAASTLSKRVKSASFRSLALEDAAVAFYASGHIAEGAKVVHLIVAEDSDHRHAATLRALSTQAVYEGDYQRAESLARKLVPTDGLFAQLRIAEALILQRRFVKAEEILREVRDCCAGFADVHRLLAIALAEQGKFTQAAESARRAAEESQAREDTATWAWILVAGDVDPAQGASIAARARGELHEFKYPGPPEYVIPAKRNLPYMLPLEFVLGLVESRSGNHENAVNLLADAVSKRPNAWHVQEEYERARRALEESRAQP